MYRPKWSESAQNRKNPLCHYSHHTTKSPGKTLIRHQNPFYNSENGLFLPQTCTNSPEIHPRTSFIWGKYRPKRSENAQNRENPLFHGKRLSRPSPICRASQDRKIAKSSLKLSNWPISTLNMHKYPRNTSYNKFYLREVPPKMVRKCSKSQKNPPLKKKLSPRGEDITFSQKWL